jgi:Flp pilus assembly protein TadD
VTAYTRAMLRRSLLCAATVSLLSACEMMDSNGEQAKISAQAAQAAVDQGGAPLNLARAARGVHDYAAAINIYKKMIASNPADTDAVVELGQTQLEAGEIDDAIVTFQSVPAASKSMLAAQLGLERASLMLSQPTKALEYADSALAIDSRSAPALIGRGVALDMLSRHAEAQVCYRFALAFEPQDIPARSDLSLSLAMTGHFDEAITIMTALARSPSATPRLRQNLALIYGLKGDTAMARGLSRMDLDARTTDDNLKFFAMVRAEHAK